MTQEEMKINHDIMSENYMIERLAEAKLESKIMTALIDTILDNSSLAYSKDELRLESDSEMFAIIKAFFSDEYDNRLTQLKAERDQELKKMNGGKKNG